MHRLFIQIIFSLATLVALAPPFAFASHSSRAIPNSVAFADRVYRDVLNRCPERVWSGVDWSSLAFTFVSRQTGAVWTVGTDGARATAIADLKFEIGTSDWAIVNDEAGRPHIVVDIDVYAEDDELAMRVATHEAFHAIGQNGWILPSRGRGDLYPLDPQPRYVRTNLFEALKGGDLATAAAWYEIWRHDFPEEYAINTDGREGTARYVEQRMLLLAHAGCNASVAAIDRAADDWMLSLELDRSDLDEEGYLLGASAALWLDRLHPDWKREMPMGRSPLDVLLGGQTPGPRTENLTLKARLESWIESRNENLDIFLGPASEQLGDKNYYRVAIPKSWQPSSLALSTFIPRSRIANSLSIVRAGPKFVHADDAITIDSPTVAVELAGELAGDTDICKDTGFYLLVSKSDVTVNGEVVRSSSLDLPFTLHAEIRTRDGFDFVCPLP